MQLILVFTFARKKKNLIFPGNSNCEKLQIKSRTKEKTQAKSRIDTLTLSFYAFLLKG